MADAIKETKDENVEDVLSLPKEKETKKKKKKVAPKEDEKFALTNEQFFEISRRLEDKHVIFYRFWQIGKPHFTSDPRLPTACVTFNKEGFNTGFYFNTDFWKSLDSYSRDFIISHEMLHVILNHGARMKDTKQPQIANVAMDLVVNHLLVEKFGFDRSRVKNAENLCWVDTVFKARDPKDRPAVDESFEHYYRLIVEDIKSGKIKATKCKGKGGGGGGDGEPGEFDDVDLPELADQHDTLDDDDLQEAVKDLNDALTDEEKESLKDTIKKHFQKDGDKDKDKGDGDEEGGKQAGTGTGYWSFVDVNLKKIKKKKKWETIIKKWAMLFMKSDIKDQEQWAREHRRMSGFETVTSIFLPSEMDVEDMYEDVNRVNIIAFLDTSGSCIHLKDRFFTAIASLPEERFNVRLFCFDTQVFETTLESKKVYGGGGTAFDILERKVQELKKDKRFKVGGVFVISDGYGSSFACEEAKKWHWFLEGNYTSYIPKGSNIYRLSDFE